MKIGVLTLSASDNCGSLLQTYALKELLKKYGDVEVINFTSAKSHALYDVNMKEGRIWSRVRHHKARKRLLRCKEGYEKFRHLQLEMEKPELYARDLSGVADKYDVVVVGSDQVWNVQMVDFDEAFFLGWTRKKKIAYAPSVGGNDISLSSNVDQIKMWLRQFSYLSAREEYGKKSISYLTDEKVEKVLDPTLVLPVEKWYMLAGDQPIIKGDYIFYYSWAYIDERTIQIVYDESKRLGLPVVVIDARKWNGNSYKKWGFTLLKDSGPYAFLNLMRYAKKVYVESFHGTIFAYLFKRDFWLLDSHSNADEMDARLKEIVNILGVQNRVMTPFNRLNLNRDTVFFENLNLGLEILREKSIKYLDKAFEDSDL